MNSNTTFVKVKFESRLMNYLAVSCYDSNTTFVKVKFDDLFYKLTLNVHSNTTFVKVKFRVPLVSFLGVSDSNTTFVKVKYTHNLHHIVNGVLFKYNIC